MDNIPKFIEDSQKLIFEPIKHVYTLDGKELISVTTFLDLFKEKFDSTGEILTRCALKEGVSEKVLKKRWNDKGTKAGKIGSDIHENIEYYLKTGKIKKNKYTAITKEFSKVQFNGSVYSEVRLFDEIGIAGTSDLVIINGNTVSVSDVKTNEKPPTEYSFKKMMKYPVEHLPAGKLILYELQISLYLYLLTSKYGYDIGNENFIFWVNRKKNEIVKIPVRLRINDIINMLSHYLYLKSLSPEELENLNKPKIIQSVQERTTQNEDAIWID